MTIEEDNALTPVKDFGDSLGHVHLGEDHRCGSRCDRGFDPVVNAREYLADGLGRARTAGGP